MNARSPQRLLTRLGVTGSLLAALPVAAQPLPSAVVAYTGQTAPGTGGATYLLLQGPTITAGGDVTFRAELTGPGVTGTNHKGYWRTSGGAPVTLLLRAGAATPLPGTTFGVDVYDPNTQTVGAMPRAGFAWDVVGGAPTGRVLWTEQTGGLRAVARMGDVLPEIPGATLTSLPGFDMKFEESGRLAFLGGFTGPGVTTANDTAIFLDDGANRTMVVREGDDVPGLPAGTVFPSFDSTAVRLAPGSDVTFHSAPFVASQSLFIDGIWSNRSGSLAPIVLEGGAAPGLGGAETVLPGFPFANRNGQIAFLGGIQGGAGGFGFWISDGGGSPALAYRLPATDPPFQFSGTHPFLADNGVFHMITHRNIAGGSRQAILAIGPSGWRELAYAGERVADLPAGIVYQLFDQLLVNAHGQVAFRATITGPGVTSSNNRVLVAHGADGALHLVARTGDTIEVSPGMMRTLFGLLIPQDVAGGPGVARGFSDTGSLVWIAQTGGISSAILVTDAGVPPPVQLRGLDVVQTVQDWDGTVPLVADKPTYVQAYLESASPVTVAPVLHARPVGGGPELPFSPLRPVDGNGEVVTATDVSATRDLWATATWELPGAWLVEGAIELEVELSGLPLDCLESAGPTPFDCKTDASFDAVPRIPLKLLTTTYQEASVGMLQPSSGQNLDVLQRMRAALPAASLDVTFADFALDGTWAAHPDMCYVAKLVARRRLLDLCFDVLGCDTLYMANLICFSLEGCASEVGGTAAASCQKTDPLAVGRNTHAHELLHQLGRQHSVDPLLPPLPNGNLPGFCGEQADPGSPGFPFIHDVGGLRRPTLGPLLSGEDAKVYGLDTLQQRIVSPNTYFEMMSYCGVAPIDFWPSSYTYTAAKTAIETLFDGPPLGPASATSGSDRLLVGGSVDETAGTASLEPFVLLAGAPPLPPPPSGGYTLRVHRSGGGSDDLAFAPTPMVAEWNAPPRSDFLILVDSPETIAAVEVLQGATPLASRAASANAPTVAVLSPNGGENLEDPEVTISWTASDTDLDPLVFVVQFSADGGVAWRTLVTDWSATSLTVERSALAGTNDGRFRVQATDGLRATSDVSDGAFTVVDNAPAVAIVRPRGSSLFYDGQALELEALALDPEDGELAGAALSWSSSLSGALGIGSPLALPVSGLADGLHVVTLTAQDAAGNLVQATTSFRVNQPALLFEDDFESGGTTLWSIGP